VEASDQSGKSQGAVAAGSRDSRTPSPHTGPDAPVFAPGEIIGGRYVVVRFIAKGGMGQVYEVDDLELKSRVALKTIAPERASSLRQLDRFRQEIQLARTVSHPNVCRVFDLGRHNDEKRGEVLFLTMELLPGETLSAHLREKGAMATSEALPLIRQMVAALAAAHELGIVHRDFKPGNVMLLPPGTGPGLKITDFGLATNPETQETVSGSHPEVVGTPDYMPPEQFRGQCSTRTDVYALGVTVFQMVTGSLPTSYETPFKPATGASGKASGTGARPKTGSGRTPSTAGGTGKRIPPRWRDAITKAMALNPVSRFASVEDFWYALSGESLGGISVWQALRDSMRRHRLAFATSAIASIAVIALAMSGVVPNPFRHVPQEKHLAVLPFLNVGNDASNQAFAEGVAESLTSKLSQLERYQKSFWVVPASDSRAVKSLDEAHRDLDVTLAITGSIQHTDDGVEVDTNLVDAANHRQLASRSIRVAANNLDELQQRVWESVADMLDLQVSPEVREELAEGETRQPDAYKLYEQGNGYLRRGELKNIDRAIDCFNKALAKDPSYALAYAGLGLAYASKYAETKNPQWMAEATRNASRAVELNGNLIPVRVSLANVYQKTGQLDKAMAEYKRVLEQDPTVIDVQLRMGQIYEAQGKFDLAEKEFKNAIARQSKYWQGYAELAYLYYNTGRFNECAQASQSIIDVAPDNPEGYYNLGAAYLALGRYDDAISVLKKGLNIQAASIAWTNLGAAYMYLGKWEEAADAMNRAAEMSPHNDVMWRNLGDAYDQIPSRLGDAREAYQKALDTATEELKVNPRDPDVLSGIALYHAHLGNAGDAEAYIARALAVAPNNSGTLFTEALVYEIIGQRDKAIHALQQAAKAGYSLEEIEKEPELRKLQSDPRYQRWLKEQKAASPHAA
jgi:eukaryotic-like serine/threonine-protein kinase